MTKIKCHYKNSICYHKLGFFLKDYISDETVFVCIGTDKCIGDSLGPLVGSFLKKINIPASVYGTISNPIHALNIDKELNKIAKLHDKKNIIGIDACLGEKYNIGEIHIRDYPIHPGKGVGKLLPNVGNTSIIGIVDSSSKVSLFTNNSIRLNLVIPMAKVIANSIAHAYYLQSNK
ncbi:hypothetical protein CLOACE_23160 [Clostridium acetireducens DSM 10703]|uniref:Sporulation protein YyaC n=1 Tax=Clostridium acetireducens DSM 10703 TaxID=1121290 RepID=A0A1E8EU95_9CLOT|nr:spore protease YyaC [Clostridium acetireducens]OFH96431.1 hypothetical protein CLOACE_23160 [Clostridium acetireducens DSM 10703]